MLSCRRYLWLAPLTLPLACGGPAPTGSAAPTGSPQGPTANGSRICPASDAPAPPLQTLPTPAGHSFKLKLALGVARSAVLDELARRVPSVLVPEQRRSLGIAGRATFEVTRGSFALSAQPKALILSLPVSVPISVCKPFAGSCLEYGQCKPELAVTFRVPMELGAGGKAPRAQSSVSATRRCVIAGLDLTEQLLDEARPQVYKVTAEVDATLAELGRKLGAGWLAAQQPRPLGPDSCLQMAPESLGIAPLRLDAGELTTQLEFSGQATLKRCPGATDAAPAARPLPALSTTTETNSDSELWLTRELDWQRLSQLLSGALVGHQVEQVTIHSLVATGALVNGQPRVVLRLAAQGESCGDVWLSARLVTDTIAGKISLAEVTPLASPDFDVLPWKQTLESTPPLALPELTALLALDRRTLTAQIGSMLAPEFQVMMSLAEPTLSEATLGPDGLRFALHTQGPLRAKVLAFPATLTKQ